MGRKTPWVSLPVGWLYFDVEINSPAKVYPHDFGLVTIEKFECPD